MGNLKKALTLALAVFMCLGLAVNAGAAFPDVPASNKYAEAIDLLQTLEILGGDETGRFNPTKTITRAEFSKVLYVVINGTPQAGLYTGVSLFSDVSADAWYTGYVNWAASNGIVGGRGDGRFDPDAPVTLQEAVKMFVVAITGKSSYAWPYGFISEAKRLGVLENIGNVSISGNAQRQIIAQMAANLLYIPSALVRVYDAGSGLNIAATPMQAIFNTSSTADSGERIILLGTSEDTNNGLDQTLISKAGQVSLGVYNIDRRGFIPDFDAYVFDYDGDASSLIGAPVIVYYKEGTEPGWQNAEKILSIKPGYASKNQTTYELVRGSSTGNAGARVWSYTVNGSKIEMSSGFDFTRDYVTATAEGGLRVGRMQYYYTTNISPITDATAFKSYNIDPAYDGSLAYLVNAYTGDPVTFYDIDGDGKYDYIYGGFQLNGIEIKAMSDITKRILLGKSAGSVEVFNGGYITYDEAEAFTGMKVGSYVNATIKVDYKGNFHYKLTPANLKSGVTLTGANSSTSTMFIDGSNINIGFTNIDHSLFTDMYSRMVSVNYGNLGKKFDVVVDSVNRLVAIKLRVDSSSSATGLNTAIVQSIGRDDSIVPSYTITLKLPDGSEKSYELAANAKIYNNAIEETLNNLSAWGNGWFKNGSDTAGELSSNVVISNGKAAITGAAVHFELDSQGKISVLTNLEEIGSKLPTGVTGMAVTDSSTQSWSNALGAFRNNEAGYTFPDAGLVAYKKVNGEYKVYTLKDLPDFSNAQVLNISLDGKVIAMVFDAWTVDTSVAMTNVGTVVSYVIEAGSALGKAKLNVTAIVDGTKATYYTEEFNVSDTELMKTTFNAAQNYLTTFDLTTDGLIKRITTLKASPADGDFTFAVITAKMGDFYRFNPIYSISSSAIEVSETASGFIMIDSSAKVYTVKAKPAVATSEQILTGTKVYTLNSAFAVGSVADVLLTAEAEAQYAVAYTTKMVSGIKMIDTMIVYTTYIGGTTVPERTLDGISISTPPTRTTYEEGDLFEADGMVVMADYSDGTSVPVTGFTVDEETPLAFGQTSVEVSYASGGVTYTADQPITVTEFPALVSIEITTAPSKLVYYYGEMFSTIGMVVTATYADSRTEIVTDYTISPNTALGLDDDTITISLTRKTVTRSATVAITVEAETEDLLFLASWTNNARSGSVRYANAANKLGFQRLGLAVGISNKFEITYNGENVDHLAGLPVTVIYSDATKTEVLDILPLGTSVQLRTGEVYKDIDGDYKLVSDNSVLPIDKAALETNYTLNTAARNSGMYITPYSITNNLFFGGNGDGNVTLVDTDEDGDYDFAHVRPVFNSLEVKAVTATTVKLYRSFGSPADTGWFENNNFFEYTLADGVEPLQVGDFVNLTMVIDCTSTTAASPLFPARLYISSKSETVSGIMTSLNYTDPYNISLTLDGTDEYTWTNTFLPASYSDGAAGINAGRPLMTSANLFYNFTLTLDETGKVVKAEIGAASALQSISVATQPTKTSYIAGETFDPAGMVIEADFAGASDIEVTGYTYSPDGLLAVTDTEIIVSFTAGSVTKTASVPITVVPPAKVLESIAVTTDPTKMTYVYGESFDAAGMVVTGYFDDESSEAITGYTVNPSGALTFDDTEITISYLGVSTTIDVTINYPADSDTWMLIGTETNNTRYSGANNVFVQSPGTIAVTAFGTATINEAAGTLIPYIGVNIDDLVGLPVTVYYTNSSKTTAVLVEVLGTSRTIRADVLVYDGARYYINGSSIAVEERMTGTRAWYKTQGTQFVQNAEVLARESMSDEIVTLVDTDGNGSYDWLYLETVFNGLQINPTLISGVKLGTLNYSLGSAQYNGWFSTTNAATSWEFEEGLTLAQIQADPSIYVNIRLRLTYGTTHAMNHVKYLISRAETVSGKITGVDRYSANSIGVLVDGVQYYWSNRFNTASDGADGVNAGRALMTEASIGATFTFVLDEAGYIVSAVKTADSVLEGISVTTAPTKVAYTAGQTFNPAGMVVKAQFDTLASAMPITTYTYGPTTALTTADTQITVSFTAGSVTRTATVPITVTPPTKTLTSIAVTTAPTKTTYTLGQSFDAAGMVVTAYYDDLSSEVITGYTYAPTGALAITDTAITISFMGEETTQAITVDYPTEKMILAATWTNNARSGSSRYANAADKISLIPYGSVISLANAVEKTYTGANIDDLAGLPVTVTFEDAAKTTVRSVAAVGTSITMRSGDVYKSNIDGFYKYASDNTVVPLALTQLEVDYAKYTFSRHGVIYVSAAHPTSDGYFFGSNGDEIVTLVDTDADGVYDFASQRPVLNAAEVIAVSDTHVTLRYSYGSTADTGWLGGTFSTPYTLADGVSPLVVGDYVNLVIILDNANGVANTALFSSKYLILSKSQRVTGVLTSVNYVDPLNITVIIGDSVICDWSNTIPPTSSTWSDGTDGVNAGRPLMNDPLSIGKTFIFLFDRNGKIVKAIPVSD